MRRTVAVIFAVAVGGLVGAAPASAAPKVEDAGCSAFGRNISDLARASGAGFGGQTSSTASGAPGLLTEVIKNEQLTYCF